MSETFYPSVIVELSEDDGGGFAAFAPDLYGCMGDGETPEEALADLKNAIGEWIDETVRMGRPIPAPGSAARISADVRAKLIDLVNKQSEALHAQSHLIGEQDHMLRRQDGLIEQLTAISEQLLEVVERDQVVQRGGTYWTYVSARPLAHVAIVAQAKALASH